jgi:ELWxxDGT repeat protein
MPKWIFRPSRLILAWMLLMTPRATEAQQLVKDINVGSPSSSPLGGVDVNGTLFFSAFDDSGGTELWKSDGTAAGTVRVKDIWPGPESSSPSDLTNVDGTLFFVAASGNNHSTSGMVSRELWKTDGTPEGTTLVKPIAASNLTNVNGTLFFSDSGGPGLWKSDGTTDGTVLLQASTSPINLRNVNGTLFFVDGQSLWKSNGTEAGTVPISRVYDSAGRRPPAGISFKGRLVFPGQVVRLYSGEPGFLVDNETLWASDGTSTGTGFLSTAPWEPAGLTQANGTVFFKAAKHTTEAAESPSTGTELWKTDGTNSGTVVVKDIGPGALGSQPGDFTNVNGRLFFTADDGVHGRELWKSDGTDAGTVLVKDIYPGSESSSPSALVSHEGLLYFSARHPDYGVELWRSDGTPEGTFIVTDASPGVGGDVKMIVSSVAGLFFTTFEDSLGYELWILPHVGATPTLSVSEASLLEDETGTLMGFTVSLSEPATQTVSVDYHTQDDSALAGSDYTAVSGTVTFSPGETSRSIVVPVTGDETIEPDETFAVRLDHAIGGVLVKATGTATILNDDPAPVPAPILQYRLYSEATGEHLYTADLNEYNVLGAQGWHQEGVTYQILDGGGTYDGALTIPFYRLYHAPSQQHHWTTDSHEARVLADVPGWHYEGVSGHLLQDPVPGAVALHRLALPSPPLHLWTTDPNERLVLTTQHGWIDEGRVGYVLAQP